MFFIRDYHLENARFIIIFIFNINFIYLFNFIFYIIL